jgi:hypothetical protein
VPPLGYLATTVPGASCRLTRAWSRWAGVGALLRSATARRECVWHVGLCAGWQDGPHLMRESLALTRR